LPSAITTIFNANLLITDFFKGKPLLFSSQERYQFRQIALLDFTYLTNFSSQIAVVSLLPTLFEQFFHLQTVSASLVAASYPFFNIVLVISQHFLILWELQL
jgi:nitrate/nitrite transporter NarK